MSDRGLLEQLDRTTETLSHSLTHLVKYASITEDKGDEEDEHGTQEIPESTVRTSTAGLMMVNAQTAQLIRGVQDLLVMTRNIREKWLLTQIPDEKIDSQRELDYQKCSQLLEQWTQEVLGTDQG
ncbi:LANO_0F10022g1_1 [Lachancea nothofagi CBS 11611]|uniref:Mediator of RNA polymerase II transcription subunit 22 n=1 Tax=Lachancea nothofagi CBS 11611 TaxID=1266666 RepID=A0A1G4KA67_9SACH|nr:LANO_0F10022g1_1 [Lachancea nothofagi CBS 11611]